MFYGPYPFCAYFEIYMQSPKIRAKRVGVIIDKICILKILFITNMQKNQGTQIIAFLRFELKGGYKYFSLFPKDKNSFI